MSGDEVKKRKSPVIPITLSILAVCLLLGCLVSGWFQSRKMFRTADSTKATSYALQLKSAAGTFFTEYRKYPVRDGSKNPERVVLSNHELMDVLMASDKETGSDGLNSRGIAFCSFTKAKPADKGKYRRGVTLDDQGGGELWDPWGNHFRIVMDTNFDNQIAAPSWVKEVDIIPQGVIVWSPGPDGDDNTAEDNIITW